MEEIKTIVGMIFQKSMFRSYVNTNYIKENAFYRMKFCKFVITLFQFAFWKFCSLSHKSRSKFGDLYYFTQIVLGLSIFTQIRSSLDNHKKGKTNYAWFIYFEKLTASTQKLWKSFLNFCTSWSFLKKVSRYHK